MEAKPEVLATRTVAQSRLFEIQQIDLRFSNGTEVCFEKLASRGHGAVMVVPLLDDDTVLLVREYAVGTDRYELALPKGAAEPGEGVLATAQRELMEEVGYGAARLESLTRLSIAPGYIGHMTELVLARDLYPASMPGDEPEPPGIVSWSLADLPALIARPDCTEARTIAGLYIVRDLLAARGTK